MQVMVGQNINITLAETLSYIIIATESEVPLTIIIPSVAGGLLVIITVFVIIMCILLRAMKRKSVHLKPFLELQPGR